VEDCNGVDDDCDGLTDEGYEDSDSDSQANCVDGDDDNDGELDIEDCEPLNPAIHHSADEFCDILDNDCNPDTADGADEEWLHQECDWNGDTDLCKEGTFQCVNGQKICNEEAEDDVELCNGEDDDCDGIPDGSEDLTQQCGSTEEGECAFGTETCSDAGEWVGCDAVGPGDEVCDGKDNDCDGTPDGSENLTQQCGTTDAGECEYGTEICNDAGGWVGCDAVGPVDEVCDGKDNDCNGLTDEDFPTKGDKCDGADDDKCENGTLTCTADGLGLECGAEDPTGVVDICDGQDNDCDGEVDEDFPSKWQACDGTDSDECLNGTWSCTEDGAGVECINEVDVDIPDKCDNLDNDCNPATADGADELWLNDACDGDGDTDDCEEGELTCVNGEQVCSDNTDSTEELCDGQDGDCDGLTDDDDPDCQ